MLRTALLLAGLLGVATGSGWNSTAVAQNPPMPPAVMPPVPVAAAKPTGDLGLVQGNWKPLQCEFQGVPQMPPEIMKQVTIVFDKSEYHLYFVDRAMPTEPKVFKLAVANVTLDAATNPKTITFEFAEGPLKGQKRHGIYQVAGNELKMCYGPSEKPKPTEFKAPAGSGHFLEVWARQVK